MTYLKRIIELLYDRRGEYVPLEELGSAVRLGQQALQRRLDALVAAGHELQTNPADGIRLVSPVRLDAHLIERGLGTRRVGRNVIVFDKTGSTSDIAFDAARQSAADGLAVLAEHQTAGRGRLGRQWVSPPHKNVMMSVLLIDRHRKLAHEVLTVAAGLATAEAVESAAGVDCGLKWPNDVLVDGAKLAGVLVEKRRRAGRDCVVIGIGLNANAAPPRQQVDRPATSLRLQLGHDVERIEVVRELLRRLDAWVARVEDGAIEPLHKAWTRRCGMINHRVEVLCDGQRLAGRVLDVDPLEGLVIMTDAGQRHTLAAQRSTIL